MSRPDLVSVPGLDPEAARRLADLVAEAQLRQTKALDEAIHGGMRHLPRLVRGPVKALLFR